MQKILLIEDDIHFQTVLATLLQRSGFMVDTVFEGHEGIERAKSGGYNLVITDIHMPDTDGINVIQNIKAFNENLPIVAISGGATFQKNDMSKLHQARHLDINAVFKKPFEHEEFIEKVRELLGIKPEDLDEEAV